MKKLLLFISLLCGWGVLSLATAAPADEPLDHIVAIVNDDVVTTSEFNHTLTVAKMQLEQAHIATPAPADLQKQVLDQLINKKLQLQLAKQGGLTISDSELSQAIQKIAAGNQMSTTDLYQRLKEQGMSVADYKNDIREQLILQKLQQQEVASHIRVSAAEVSSFLRSKAWQNKDAKEYHLEDLLIPLNDNPSPQQITAAKKQAEGLLSKLHHGQNFDALTSAGANQALQSGDLGWRKLAEIPSAFADQVMHMNDKQVAGPIQAPNGFHIIYLLASRADSSQQAAPNHQQAEQLVFQKKFSQEMQTWVSKLRGQAFIVTNPTK